MSRPKVTKRKEKPPGTKTDTSAPMSAPKVAKDKSPGKKKDTSTVTPAAATPAKGTSEQRTSPRKRISPAKTEIPEWGKSRPSKLRLKKKNQR